MAKNFSTVYLGFEDDAITDKNKFLVNFTTNKVGGHPIWPSADVTIPPCTLCGLKRPLIMQIYAPLDNSQFYRTLYIFSCPNATCSNDSSGWTCVRVQQIEKVIDKDNIGVISESQSQHHHYQQQHQRTNAVNINWCSGANEWDDGGDDAYTTADADNCNEQNGNVIRNDNRMSDEDDESNSLESDPIPGFDNLQVDDRNANCGAQGGGAVGRMNSPKAFAEIEGEESELVSIDAPKEPQRDLIALLKQTTAIPSDVSKITLKSFFISVDEEKATQQSSPISDHVRELLQEYQIKDEKSRTSPSSPGNIASGGICGGGDGEENYEKGIPIHGDLMFHHFLLTIHENPGQILRYSRDTLPLLIAPLPADKQSPKCQYCTGEMTCEIQILPTLIPKLRFVNGEPAPLEYGNVLVYTCNKSCWDTPDKMRVEVIVVQSGI